MNTRSKPLRIVFLSVFTTVNMLILVFLAGGYWLDTPREPRKTYIHTQTAPPLDLLCAPLDTPDQCTIKEMNARQKRKR